jgi:hypothetical protein
MADFIAVQDGPLDDGATFDNTSPGTEGVDWPSATDSVDAAGFALTQGFVAQLAMLTTDTAPGGSLTIERFTFTCPIISNVAIIVPDGVSTTLVFGTPPLEFGCVYFGSGAAVECQEGGQIDDIIGGIENSGSGYGIYQTGGRIQDVSADIVNSGAGVGFYQTGGQCDEFHGDVVNSGEGYGVVIGSGCIFGDFWGKISNTGTGYGLYIDGSLSEFAGECLGTYAGITLWVNTGQIEQVTGMIGNASSQVDCDPENILAGKTILGVVGTLEAGTGGAPGIGRNPLITCG